MTREAFVANEIYNNKNKNNDNSNYNKKMKKNVSGDFQGFGCCQIVMGQQRRNQQKLTMMNKKWIRRNGSNSFSNLTNCSRSGIFLNWMRKGERH